MGVFNVGLPQPPQSVLLRPTKSIINSQSTGPVNAIGVAGTTSSKEVLSGALVAGTLKALLSIAGAGQVPQLIAYSKNATNRTIRLKVTVDSIVVFDSTTNAFAVSGNGLLAVGQASGGTDYARSVPLNFNSSLLIEVASSLSETDFVAIGYVAQLF